MKLSRNGIDVNMRIYFASLATLRTPSSRRRLVPGRIGDIAATGRLRRLFWRVADDLDYLWTLAMLRILDRLAGPLPEKPGDQQRERE
jgi:hypothetical protein